MSLFSVILVSFGNSQDLSAEQVQRFLGPSPNNSGLLSFEFKSHGLEGSFLKIYGANNPVISSKNHALENFEFKSCGPEGPIVFKKWNELSSLEFKNLWTGKL